MVDFDKPIRTRVGKNSCRVICRDYDSALHRGRGKLVMVLVYYEDANAKNLSPGELPYLYAQDGEPLGAGPCIENVPDRVSRFGFIAENTCGRVFHCSTLYPTINEFRDVSKLFKKLIATIEYVFENGKIVDTVIHAS